MSQSDPARILRLVISQGDRELRRTAFRFAEDFRELRLRAGVPQRAIAAAIGVDRSVITRLERGDPGVSPTVRARACAVFGADFRMQLYRERSALIYDAGHARLVNRLIAFVGRGWRTELELALPGRRSVDVSLVRAFQIGAVHRIEARVEAFNVFNWNNWGNPVSQITNANFGRILTVGDPRIMQFALKYSF